MIISHVANWFPTLQSDVSLNHNLQPYVILQVMLWCEYMPFEGQKSSKFSQNLSIPGMSHYGWNYVKNTYFITAFYAPLRQFYVPFTGGHFSTYFLRINYVILRKDLFFNIEN